MFMGIYFSLSAPLVTIITGTPNNLSILLIKNLAAGGNSSKVLHCPVSIPHPGSRMFCLELGV